MPAFPTRSITLRARSLSSTFEVAYDLTTPLDSPAAAGAALRDLATSRLLTLAAEFDASGSPAMAQYARRIAREVDDGS